MIDLSLYDQIGAKIYVKKPVECVVGDSGGSSSSSGGDDGADCFDTIPKVFLEELLALETSVSGNFLTSGIERNVESFVAGDFSIASAESDEIFIKGSNYITSEDRNVEKAHLGNFFITDDSEGYYSNSIIITGE